MALGFITAKGIAKGATAVGLLGGTGVAIGSVGSSIETLPVGCSMTEVVEDGGSWSQVAAQYRMSAESLAAMNETTTDEVVHPGDLICTVIGQPGVSTNVSVDYSVSNTLVRDGSNCMPGTETYEIQVGDGPIKAAEYFGFPLETVYDMNPGLKGSTVFAGDILCSVIDLGDADFSGDNHDAAIPVDETTEPKDTCKITADVNGDGDKVTDDYADVLAFQKQYNKATGSSIVEDGSRGPQTNAAIKDLQKIVDTKVDCDYGDKSKKKYEDKFGSSDTTKSRGFDASLDCPSKFSCEIRYDLSERKGYITENDGVWSTANGKVLYQYPIVPGGSDNSTDTGHFTLGPVEYGVDGNPWRLSTITASSNPNAAPNMYKFRRHNPVDGSHSGEGTHGTRTFYGVSSGCARTEPYVQDIIAQLPTGTSILIEQ